MVAFMAAIGAVTATAAAIYPAAQARADTVSNSCGPAPLPICLLVPTMPDLDHDVDLTTDPNGRNVDGSPDIGAPQGSGPG